MVSNWVITLIYPIYKQVKPFANFQRDIQAEDIFWICLTNSQPSSHFSEAARPWNSTTDNSSNEMIRKKGRNVRGLFKHGQNFQPGEALFLKKKNGLYGQI